MPVNDFKTFGVGPGDDATSQAEYLAATWRVEGWRSGILPHQQVNKVLRQTSTIAAAIAQTVADQTQLDVLDSGDVVAITNLVKQAFSAYLPYNSGTTYPVGSIGWAIQNNSGGAGLSADILRSILTGHLTEAEFTTSLNNRLNLLDAPTTGLVTKVSGLETTYGSVAAAAVSASSALASANAASVSAGAALTSQNAASSSATAASTSAGSASTQATNAANSATSAAGSASSASTNATTASTAATSATNSAAAASTSAGNAATSATAAGTSASAASTSATSANTSASSASTSASSASTSATSATGSANTATTAAATATSAQSAAAGSASAANTSSSSAAVSASSANTSALAAATHYTNTVSATGALTSSLSTEIATRASETGGLQAQYVMKVIATRTDGRQVFGMIGLAATLPTDGTGGQSEILLQADRLVFIPSGNPNAAMTQLMAVGTVNGVATLIVNQAVIGDNVIGPRSISTPNLAALSALLGNVRIDSAGQIIMGMSAYGVGDGICIGYDAGEYSIVIGNKAGAYLEYKPSTGLKIVNAQALGVSGIQTIGNYGQIATRVSPSGSVTVLAKVELRSDGSIYGTKTNSTGTNVVAKLGNWFLPNSSGVGNDYEVIFEQLTNDGGTVTNQVVSYAALSSDRSISLSATSNGFFAYTLTGRFTVRRLSDSQQVAIYTVSLYASRET